MIRELRLCDVPRDAHKELQQILPDLPDLDEHQNQNLPKPPAAGLMTQHQDVFFIPPPSRCWWREGDLGPTEYGNAGANSQTWSISRGAVARGSRLYDVTIHKSTCLQYDAPHSNWHVGPTGFPPTMGRGDASSGWSIDTEILRTLCS